MVALVLQVLLFFFFCSPLARGPTVCLAAALYSWICWFAAARSSVRNAGRRTALWFCAAKAVWQDRREALDLDGARVQCLLPEPRDWRSFGAHPTLQPWWSLTAERTGAAACARRGRVKGFAVGGLPAAARTWASTQQHQQPASGTGSAPGCACLERKKKKKIG